MGAFDDLIPKAKDAAPPSEAPAVSAPGSAFADLVPKREQTGKAMSVARGAMQGLTFGLADESYGLMKGIGSMVSGGGFSEGYNQGVEEYRARDKIAKEDNPVSSVAGEIAGGMGTGLGLAKGGVTLMRQGMTLPQAMKAGLAEGAAYGAAYGAGNAEGGPAERIQGAVEGAGKGAAIGAAVPAIARGISAGVGKVVSPIGVSPERQAMVDTLAREGVPLTAGQRTGSIPLQYSESILGNAPLAGGRAAKIAADQGEAFTHAAMRRAGGSGRASPENLQTNFDRIGKEFTDLSARNTLQADRQLATDLGSTLTKYDRLLPSEQKQIIGNLASDIVERIKAGNGTMPGEDYQAIRSWLTTAAQGEGNQHAAKAMKGMRDALDNNMMRSISPEDAAAWQTARREYGNIKDIAKAAGGAGAGTAEGIISPQALRSAVASGKNREAYARGQGDFAELARAGNAVMTPLPNSGTAQRTLISGQAGAGGAAAYSADPMWAAIIAAGPTVAGRILMSPMGQAYFGNKAISPAARTAIENRLRAMLQGGAESQSPRLPAPSR